MKVRELINKLVKDITKNIVKRSTEELSNYIVRNATNYILSHGISTLSISSYSIEYHNFCRWFKKHKNNENINYFVNNNETYYFRYMNKLFSVTNLYDTDTKLKSLRIRMFGKNKKIMSSLYNEFKFKNTNSSTIYTSGNNSDWRYVCEVPKRDINTVVIDSKIKESILKRIKDWQESRAWYKDRGLSYKLGLVLYGPPGTGKTSFIKALASYLEYDVYILDLNTQSDLTLSKTLSSTGKKSIIVMEDFDSVKATLSRDNTPNGEVKDEILGVTTSGLLNAMDGLAPLDDRIIIMTTNHLEKIDPALVRKGRIDEKFYFGPLSDKEIKEYIKIMCPDYKLEKHDQFDDINGCDIQDLYLQNKFKDKEFVDSIPRLKK